MKAEPVALLAIFESFQDSAVHADGGRKEGAWGGFMPFSDREENTLTSPTPTLPSAKGGSLQLPENWSSHTPTSYLPMPFPW